MSATAGVNTSKITYVPRDHYVIVEPVKAATSIVTPELESSEQSGTLFKVITVGNDVEIASVGDLVFIVGYIHTVSHNGRKFTLVKDTDIIMTIKEEA